MEDAENEGWKTRVEYGKHSLQFTRLHFDSASFFTPTFSVNPGELLITTTMMIMMLTTIIAFLFRRKVLTSEAIEKINNK